MKKLTDKYGEYNIYTCFPIIGIALSLRCAWNLKLNGWYGLCVTGVRLLNSVKKIEHVCEL